MSYLPGPSTDCPIEQHQPCQMLVIAPAGIQLPPDSTSPCPSQALRESLIAQVQRLRGRVYLDDGALQPWQLTSDGRHIQPVDGQSWHLVTLNNYGLVSGCVRYWQPKRMDAFSQLGVAQCALVRSPLWGRLFERAVQEQREEAERRGIGYAELGGWALTKELRHTGEGIRLALSLYALGKMLGEALAISTATTRHKSSCILRRIGGQPLSVDGIELPPYFEPQYGCEMEILRFDSAYPNWKFRSRLNQCMADLSRLPVVCTEDNLPYRKSLENLGLVLAQGTKAAASYANH